jgi:hypothetical protein
LTTFGCTAGGQCMANPTDCPGNYACENATTCRTSCADSTECATNFVCNAPTCAAM